jgi:hypothetical protein
MASDIYKELAYDIFANTSTDLAQAENIVDWLKHEGLLDYDNLKEYYDEDA